MGSSTPPMDAAGLGLHMSSYSGRGRSSSLIGNRLKGLVPEQGEEMCFVQGRYGFSVTEG